MAVAVVQKPETLKCQTMISALRKWFPVDRGGTMRLASVHINLDTGAIQSHDEFAYRYEVVRPNKLLWNCHEDEVADILWHEHTRVSHMQELILYKSLQAHREGSMTVPGNIPRAVCKMFCKCCVVCNTHLNPGAGQKIYRQIKSNWVLERMQAEFVLPCLDNPFWQPSAWDSIGIERAPRIKRRRISKVAEAHS